MLVILSVVAFWFFLGILGILGVFLGCAFFIFVCFDFCIFYLFSFKIFNVYAKYLSIDSSSLGKFECVLSM